MKQKYMYLLVLLLGTFSFSFQANAANDNSGMTAKEKALWEDAFGADDSQTAKAQAATTQKTKPQKRTNQTAPGNISGHWVGYYEYDKPRGQPAGMFSAAIKDLDGQFLITFLEFSNQPDNYIQWAGNTTAKRQGKYIEFIKVYGHNDTKIQYNLTISHGGDLMDGTWKINDNTYGRAFFYKVHLQNLKNIRQESID